MTITLHPGRVSLAELAQIYWSGESAVLDRSFDAGIEKAAARIAEIAAGNGGGLEAAEGAGRQVHVRGVEQHQQIRMQAADKTGKVLRRGGGIHAAPGRMPEGAGENGPERVVAVARMADAEKQIHGGKFWEKETK